MTRCKAILLCFLLLILSATSFAQKKDSVFTIKTIYTTLEYQAIKADSFRNVDTTLDFINEYNPAYSFERFGVTSGIYGSPYRSILYDAKSTSGFHSGLNAYDIYRVNRNTIRYFDTYTPFSELFYVQGGGELQKLYALHTRNITPYWNVAINYFTNISSEFYGNTSDLLKNKVKNLNLSSRYRSKSGNYTLYASFISNKINASDIGGINDTAYSRYSTGDKYYANVFLENARISFLDKQISLNHSLKIERQRDDTINREKKAGGLFLVHSLLYQKLDVNYTDKDISDEYFNSVYYSNDISNDSIDQRMLQNEISLMALSSKNSIDKFKVGLRHHSGRIIQNGHDSSLIYLTGVVQLRKKILKGIALVEVDYVLSGSNINDYLLEVVYDQALSKSTHWFSGAILQRNTVDYIYTLARSNHLHWQNNFNPTDKTSIFTGISNKDKQLFSKLSYNLLSNYVYLNEFVDPVQINSPFSVLSLQLQKNFIAGKFHFNNHVALQHSTNENALAVPLWTVNHLSYYEGQAFKGNLNLQMGFSVRLTDTYYADGLYAPFSLFYRQQSVETTMYPMVDVFINASVKRAKGFVKYEHVNQGFPAGEYFIVDGYQYKKRAFVFGISWLFFD